MTCGEKSLLIYLPQNHRTQDSKVTCSLFGLSKARQIMYISSQTVLKNLQVLTLSWGFGVCTSSSLTVCCCIFTCGLKKSIQQHVLEKTSKDDLVQLFT